MRHDDREDTMPAPSGQSHGAMCGRWRSASCAILRTLYPSRAFVLPTEAAAAGDPSTSLRMTAGEIGSGERLWLATRALQRQEISPVGRNDTRGGVAGGNGNGGGADGHAGPPLQRYQVPEPKMINITRRSAGSSRLCRLSAVHLWPRRLRAA